MSTDRDEHRQKALEVFLHLARVWAKLGNQARHDECIAAAEQYSSDPKMPPPPNPDMMMMIQRRNAAQHRSVDMEEALRKLEALREALGPPPVSQEPPKLAEPPRLAESALALFLKGAKGEAVIGDLNERFHRDCRKYGVARARQMYRAQVLRSLWPLAWRAAKRVGIFVEIVRFFSGS
jgi:hypothetical protein